MNKIKKLIIKIISEICKFYFTYRYFGKIQFGKNIQMNWRFSFSGNGKLKISDGVSLWAHEEYNRFQTYSKNAVINIGKNSKINGALFQAKKSIIVSENCMIGSAIILDNDFHNIEKEKRFLEYEENGKSIFIGKNVWIAGQTVILKGVQIGENSVVAIRAVVSKNVEKNVVVAGNPAKMVKTL